MAVPTLEVVAMNVPVERGVTLIVALNMKKETVYAGVFKANHDGQCWQLKQTAGLTTLAELLATITGPVVLVGEKLAAASGQYNRPHPNESEANTPTLPEGEGAECGQVKYHSELSQPRSENVWRVGCRLALQNQYTPAHELLPLYVRIPEAVELWEKRQGAGG